VQFAPIALTQALVGDFWQRIKATYPTTEDQPALESGLEAERGAPGRPLVEVSFGPPPLHRSWFTAADGRRLVQVQADRLLLNWRREPEAGAYEHFEPILDDFERLYGAFVDWCLSSSLTLTPVQIEVDYINGWQARCLADALRLVPPVAALGDEVSTEERWQARFPLTGRGYLGGLYVDAVREADNASYALVVRARLDAAGWDAIETALLMGRRAIVETFADSLTPEATTSWGGQP
jgi:hypothetical protein